MFNPLFARDGGIIFTVRAAVDYTAFPDHTGFCLHCWNVREVFELLNLPTL